jgi:YHS domain-containing protein
MFRSIVEFLLLLLFFAVARGVISALGQAFRGAVQGPGQAAGAKASSRSAPNGELQSAGELRKDPVCGTFVATATSLNRVVDGETFYFCSAECRDRFPAYKK